MVSRFFASSEYSKWPLNANVFFAFAPTGMGAISAGVAEWEEPRDSGLFACRHSYPLSPTLQLFSPLVRRVCIADGALVL
jgi:hypothetical protein